MDKEVEKFRKDIRDAYKKVGLDVIKKEPWVYDNKHYWEALYQSCIKGGYNYDYLKKVFDSCSRPSRQEIENYKENPANKVSDTQYAAFDDKTFGIADIYPTDIPHYYELLKLIYRYEEEEQKHVHKGNLFYFLLEEHLKMNQIEEGLLFINKAFIEDDLKHKDTIIKFPDSPAYKFVVLNAANPNQALFTIVKEIVDFMKNEFMNGLGFSYKQFWGKFLNEASNKSNIEEAHTWLDHVIFFNSFVVRLKKIYSMPPEFFDSIFGEIVLSNIIGDLCLLIESFCKVKLNLSGKTIGEFYPVLKKIYGWSTDYYKGNDFKGANLESTLKNILGDNYNGCKDNILNSFNLTWGLRNNFHHNIESMSIIKQYFKEIIKKQVDFFFDFAINK